MDRVELDGDVEVTFVQQGDGEPVLLVHASAFASWYVPLADHITGCSTLRFRRRPRASAPRGTRTFTVGDDAAVCARVMDHVGWPAAHVVGHSYGALVALQLAMEAPDRVASIALLEPAARGVSSSEQVVAALQPIIAAYAAGDTPTAVDAFLRHVCGDGYRADLDRALPGAFDEALAEADLFFQVEMPAVQGWRFGPADAERVAAPVLNVRGDESVRRFAEASDLVQSWFPDAETLRVPHAGHLLMVQNPEAVARGLERFVAQHPAGVEGLAEPDGSPTHAPSRSV